MKYLAVLGRQPKISLAELESLFENVQPAGETLAEFSLTNDSSGFPDIQRLGGTLKLAYRIELPIVQFLKTLPPEGKITLGLSDYSVGASAFKAQGEALKLKRILTKLKHSVRVVPNKAPILSTATSFHNHLWTDNKLELIKYGKTFYRVIGVQNIDAYTKRDQVRPARDAKVGMLPPKLAQILINLCGELPSGSVLLDPFCGTGVVLQEGMLMGYKVQGSDLSERMVEYSERNLQWLTKMEGLVPKSTGVVTVEQGDAASLEWQSPIDLVACETYLGQPMSSAPAEIKLKQEKQECRSIVLGFLKNLASQITSDTPVTIAVPAWLRNNGEYERLNLLDEIQNLGYNVKRFRNLGQKDLLYHRDGQVVAREIIVLRKK